jgi:hypothetical protein
MVNGVYHVAALATHMVEGSNLETIAAFWWWVEEL